MGLARQEKIDEEFFRLPQAYPESSWGRPTMIECLDFSEDRSSKNSIGGAKFINLISEYF